MTYDEAEDMEEMTYDEAEDMEETYGNMEEEDMEETVGMEKEEKEMEEDIDEEIDLEEILSELELEEGEEANEEKVDEAKKDDDDKMEEAKHDDKDDVKEAKDDDDDVKKEAKDDKEKDLEEYHAVNPQASDVSKVDYGTKVMEETEEFDLDALLKEIESLDEKKDEDDVKEAKDDMDEGDFGEAKDFPEPTDEAFGNVNPVTGGSFGGPKKSQFAADARDLVKKASSYEDWQAKMKDLWTNYKGEKPTAQGAAAMIQSPNWKRFVQNAMNETELEETKAALETVKAELNEVNLLNSKLLYVNRIFKANQLDESQKLRVVETLDKAESAKEAKLIYETIKDTFNVAKSKKASFKNKTKSLKEGIGMASKAAGTSTAPKKEVISESNNMVNRFQKLANITINQ